jgi:hypothetical protein
MSVYNIGIKGEAFYSVKGDLKNEYNNYDILQFTNDDNTSPVINIYKINDDGYNLDASSGYIINKGHQQFSKYSKNTFEYTLAYTGDYEVFIVNPTFILKGYQYKVILPS